MEAENVLGPFIATYAAVLVVAAAGVPLALTRHLERPPGYLAAWPSRPDDDEPTELDVDDDGPEQPEA